MSLVVDLGAESVGELFGGAAAFLAQVVTLSEVLAQVLIIAVDSGLKNKKFSHVAIRFSQKKKIITTACEEQLYAPVVFLRAICIAEVAEEVVPP